MIRKHSVCALTCRYVYYKIEFGFILKSEFADLMFEEIKKNSWKLNNGYRLTTDQICLTGSRLLYSLSNQMSHKKFPV